MGNFCIGCNHRYTIECCSLAGYDVLGEGEKEEENKRITDT
jgi:hypothetical protein